ncbi:ATE1 [Sanghuangporus weigelae]
MPENVIVLQLVGSQSHTCGYCSPPGERSNSDTSHSIGAIALSLICSHYQMMIDRGWRRSGDYCYKPDMRRTCCPQYTIKLDVLNFTLTRSQRKVVYRWNRFVLDGAGDPEEMDVDVSGSSSKGKTKKAPPFSLIDSIHASESVFTKPDSSPRHRFEVIMEPSSYSQEKFELYRHYQQTIHKEERKEHTPRGFKRFLVESPLEMTPIEYERTPPDYLPKNYGSYHQIYRLDGELIAMSVLDILPSCVSCVYFIYNSKWERFSLGKYSALREAALAREMHEYGAKDLKYLYLGFYVHSCQKMRYKGDYSPSFLLDPEEYTWYPLKDCIPLLNENRYACFSHPEHSLKGNAIPEESIPEDLSEEDMSQILTFHRSLGTIPLSKTNVPSSRYLREIFFRAIEGLGVELAKQVVLTL